MSWEGPSPHRASFPTHPALDPSKHQLPSKASTPSTAPLSSPAPVVSHWTDPLRILNVLGSLHPFPAYLTVHVPFKCLHPSLPTLGVPFSLLSFFLLRTRHAVLVKYFSRLCLCCFYFRLPSGIVKTRKYSLRKNPNRSMYSVRPIEDARTMSVSELAKPLTGVSE